MKGEKAGTTLQNLILGFKKPSEEATDLFHKHFDPKQVFPGGNLSFEGLIKEIRRSKPGNDLVKMFDTEAMRGTLLFKNMTGDDFQNVLTGIQKAPEVKFSASKASQINRDSPIGKVKALESATDSLLRSSVSDTGILDLSTKIIEKATGLLQGKPLIEPLPLLKGQSFGLNSTQEQKVKIELDVKGLPKNSQVKMTTPSPHLELRQDLGFIHE